MAFESYEDRPKKIVRPEFSHDSFQGLLGDFVKYVEPRTEADPIAVAAHFLAYFSAANLGKTKIHCGTEQKLNLYMALVGPSATGRKGTSREPATVLFGQLDGIWNIHDHVISGLSSGEGLITRLSSLEGHSALVVEEEISRIFVSKNRENNTLSAILREGFDGRDLNIATKSPIICRDTHLSLIAHVTPYEINEVLGAMDFANGFANRISWIYVERKKVMPFTEPYSFSTEIKAQLSEAIAFGRATPFVTLSGEAKELWSEKYESLTSYPDTRVNQLFVRATSHVTRIAGNFALLDLSSSIETSHLQTALTFWDYSERSCRAIFLGPDHSTMEQKILVALATDGELTKTDITHDLFNRNDTARVNDALHSLRNKGLVETSSRGTNGRPATVWFLTPDGMLRMISKDGMDA